MKRTLSDALREAFARFDSPVAEIAVIPLYNTAYALLKDGTLALLHYTEARGYSVSLSDFNGNDGKMDAPAVLEDDRVELAALKSIARSRSGGDGRASPSSGTTT